MSSQTPLSLDRVHALDAIKALGIFLVCYYHVSQASYDVTGGGALSYLNYFFHGLGVICVPLFFMASGYFLFPRKLDFKKHIFRTGRIYLIALIWSAIILACTMVLNEKSYSLTGFIKGTLFLEQGTNNIIWFMFAFVSIYLFFPLLKLAYDHPDRRYIYWVLFLLFIFSFGNLAANWAFHVLQFFRGAEIDSMKEKIFFPLQDVVPFGGYFYAHVYFIIGGLLNGRWKPVTPSRYLAILCGVSAFTLFLYGIMATKISGDKFDTVFAEYYSIPALISTICIFILLLRHWQRPNRIVDLVGLNTLGIYMLHIPLNRLANKYLPEIPYRELFLTNYAYAALLVLASLGVVLLMKRIPVIRELVKI